MFERYVAIGDSFTEGVGDEMADGAPRGWADLVAVGLASVAPLDYANLAVRGKLLGPIVADQLEPALALRPDLLTLCGGGNDVMRPRVSIDAVVNLLERVVDRATEQGAHTLVLTGANPTRHLPMGALIARRGDQLADACRSRFDRPGVTFVDNWVDPELAELGYWSADRLHLNARGHTRVAARVLGALDVPVPAAWGTSEGTPVEAPPRNRVQASAYYLEHVLPWIGRRLTGRSSGDGRAPKRPLLEAVTLP